MRIYASLPLLFALSLYGCTSPETVYTHVLSVENVYDVTTDDLADALTDVDALGWSTQVTEGWQITRIPVESALHDVGIKSHDVFVEVDGHPIEDADDAWDFYWYLDDVASGTEQVEFVVDILRDGVPMTLTVKVSP